MKFIIKIVLIILFSCSLVGCTDKEETKESSVIYGYEKPENNNIVIENDDLELHFDTDTTQFYVKKKSSGAIWYSNPLGADNDELADNSSKDALRSTLIMKYGTAAGVTTSFNNFSYSIAKGIYNYEVLDNGIKVNYSLGDIERIYYIPMAVPESRMLEFYDKLEKKDQRQIDEYYRRYDINKLRTTDNKAELLEKYPDLKDERVYVLRDSVAPYLKIIIEELMASAGYTVEDYEFDIARYENEISMDKPVFNVSVIYKIDGDNFLVSVPYEEMEYPKEYPITDLKILPYFGAGGIDEDGYMLVPDGSGAIIRFNNGKQSQSAYSTNAYGWDYALSREALIDESRSAFSLYGIAKDNNSFICMLEDGAAYATVEADVSGRLHNFNYVSSSYTINHGEVMDISSKSDKVVKVYESSLPKEELTLRYMFIDSENYTDMAFAYRDYLQEEYPTLIKREEDSLPVAIEVIAATDRVKQRFGFPVTVAEPLTTYEEAAMMIESLYAGGITNISVNLNGWFNQGITHKVPDKVSLISSLGGNKDFTNMIERINSLGANLYLQGSFEFIYKNELLDGFHTNRDSAKFLSRELVKLNPYSAIWYGEKEFLNDDYYLAKPTYTLKLIDAFKKEINKYNINNIAFGDVGQNLGSDYNPKNPVSRDAVIKLQKSKLEELRNEGSKLMFYTGNDYILPYADFIIDMKLDSRGYLIVDEEIPFYQIALHGIIPYAGKAINLAEDYTKNLLKTIETGAGLYYVFMDEPIATLQESNYTRYFGSDYSKWKEDSISLYKELNGKLSGTYNLFITDHKKLDEGIYMTVYENGTKSIVNYNKSSYIYNGIEVLGLGYYIEWGNE